MMRALALLLGACTSLATSAARSEAPRKTNAPPKSDAPPKTEGPPKIQAPPKTEASDEIVFRDGTRLEGRVVQQEPGRFVIIDTPDRRRRTLDWSIIRTVNLAPPPDTGAITASPIVRPRHVGVVSYEVRAQLSQVLLGSQKYERDGSCATGTGSVPVSLYGQGDSGRAAGVGGGPGVRVAYMHIYLPRPQTSSSWWAFRAGGGVDLEYLYGRLPTGVQAAGGAPCATAQRQSTSLEYEGGSIFLLQMPLNFGVHVGLGGFRDGSTWKGLVFGAAWSPTFTYTNPAAGEASSAFKVLGTELSIDFTTLDAMTTERKPQPHLRIAAFILPPMKDGDGMSAALSFGAVWY